MGVQDARKILIPGKLWKILPDSPPNWAEGLSRLKPARDANCFWPSLSVLDYEVSETCNDFTTSIRDVPFEHSGNSIEWFRTGRCRHEAELKQLQKQEERKEQCGRSTL